MSNKLETRNNTSSLYIAIFIAIVAVLVTTILLRRFKRGLKTVLLTGLSDSGKTALFTKLVFNKPKKSVTSLKENEATLNDFNLKLVDLPGAERLRSRFWEQYRSIARSVVFVIDSTNVESKLRDLNLEGANKRDKIRDILERELNAIKATKTGQLGKTSDEEETDYLVRQDVKEITFDMLKVDFIETSMHNLDHLVKLIL